MTEREIEAPLCDRVLDRLIDGGDVGAEPALAEHLGSCVTCFRSLTELRDAPRVAEALRENEAARVPPPGDRFWDELAIRTAAAIGAETSRPEQEPQEPEEPRETPARAAPPAAAGAQSWSWLPRGWAVSRGARATLVAAAIAAAAAWALAPRRLVPSSGTPGGPPAVASVAEPERSLERPAARTALEDERGVDDARVNDELADLDGQALRRVLERLRAQAATRLASFGGDARFNEDGDVLGDDDPRVEGEIADLDRAELQRVASSLAGSPL